ncbi:MAG TPA: NAD-glutamate dehydrogenase, partial [Lysobacter sp.]|nr:NAD-glutamate dehydrogenase [Lysobacter sp.]
MRKRLPKARHAEGEAFINAFYRRMSEDELPQHSADGWAALAVDFLDFARARKPGTALVRLFNPTIKSHGWESAHTVVQIANDDMPFIVDTVTMALAEQGIGVHVLGHPVVTFQRDKAGKLLAVGGGVAESLMHLEIDRHSPEAMAKIKQSIEAALADVRAMVRDWQPMRDKMTEVAEELGKRKSGDPAALAELREFLRWAGDNHFTFLGYREYEVAKEEGKDVLRGVKGSGLGLLRGHEAGARPLTSLPAHNKQREASDALILTKTNARSTVHRPGYMDYIGVLEFDAKGRAVVEHRFLGLYTSSAYNRRPWDIPLVRQRHEYVMQQSGLGANSHSGKALRHILETLPRDELFQSSGEELLRTSTGILGLQERVRSKLFLRRDRYGRFFSGLVYIPRDRFNTDVRLRIEAMLKERLHGEYVDTNVQLSESPLAQLHLVIRPKSGDVVEVDNVAIETELAGIIRNWHDDLREQLVASHGEEKGLALTNRYGRALPAGYIEDVGVAVAAQDIGHLAALAGPDDLRLSLHRTHKGEGGLRFKFYRQNDDIPLSDALPMMENMGLRVISEHPYRLAANGQVFYVQDFEVETTGVELDIDNLDENFEDAFAQIWRGNAENDGFNRLILGATLSWRQVAMLRGYFKYLLQVGVPFSQSYVEATFARYPLLARLLVEVFEAKFDPATGSESKVEIKSGMERFGKQLAALAGGDGAMMAAVLPVVEARAGKRDAQVEATRGAFKAL